METARNKLTKRAVKLLGERVIAVADLKHQLDAHRAGAVISCDESCFCWVVEAWFNRREEDGK